MKTALIVLLVLAVVGGLEVENRYFTIRNDLNAQREQAMEEWSRVGDALQQRGALISELASKRGLAEFSAVGSQDIADARKILGGKSGAQEKLAANERLSAVLSRLMVDINNNPRLQTDPSFSRWKDELANCDNQVAVARSRYNRMLEKYNARIQEFPDSLVASMAGFHRDDAYFQTQEAAAGDVKR